MRCEIDKLLEKQVIRSSTHEEGEFISGVFLREKKDINNFRFILNLKKLNELVTYHHFKMDSLASIKNMIHQDCFFTRLDFSDAYYSVNVHHKYRKYLKFQFEDKLYEFTALPNGLSSAPRAFTKIMKVPLAHLRENFGYNLVGYIDDIILTQDTEEEMYHATKDTMDLLLSLGFTISVKKSVVRPTQVIEFLGFQLDSINMTVSLTTEKAKYIGNFCRETMAKRRITIRHFAKLLGTLNATEQGNKYCQLYTRQMEIEKTDILRKNAGNYDKMMDLTPKILEALTWWASNIATVDRPIRMVKPDLIILTDASLKGWGCHIEATQVTTGGRWSEAESKLHINVLELMAVLNSLQSCATQKATSHIRIMTDNTTTMQCINNQGSARSIQCNAVALSIWNWIISNGTWVSAAHIPGVDNVEADKASREFNDTLEWSLNVTIFDKIIENFGAPDIDLFASRLNNKIDRYCAWRPDPHAQHIDAFTIEWSNEYSYIFPPFSMIGPILAKLREERARAILICPWWPTQPWVSTLASMLVATPRCFPLQRRTLTLAHDTTPHALVGRLTLLGCKLSGRPSESGAFRRMLRKRCSNASENRHTDSIHHTLRDGLGIVSRDVWIAFAPL